MSDFTFSEHGEDILIHRLLLWKKKGFYIDCGCYHPRKMSMTARLRNFGWSGMNIDADKRVIDVFNLELSNYINVNTAISDVDGEVDLQRYEDPVINTISKKQLKHLNAIEDSGNLFTKKLDCIKIKSKSLSSLIEEYSILEVDFLNLDIEEVELDALKGFPWDKLSPNVIACEMHRLNLETCSENEIVQFLKDKGYILQSYVFHTSIFVKNNFDTELCHQVPFKRL